MTSTTFPAVDVAIIGGGIIGCTIAYELSRNNVSVAIIERGALAREASWASAGIIGPPSGSGMPPAKQELAVRSARAYPWLIATVEEQTGLETGYRRYGKVLVARNEEEVESLQSTVSWHSSQDFESDWLDTAQLREVEPLVPEDVLGGLLDSDAGGVFVHRLSESIAEAARLFGTTIYEHLPAHGIAHTGDKVTGVETAQGLVPAENVVIAAGAWTGMFGTSLNVALPSRPVKGQMLSITSPSRIPQHIIGNAFGGYLVPRTDGTIAVGATKEDVGYDTRVTPMGMAYCLNLINTLGPALMDSQIVTTWAGLRPASGDDDPMIGRVPGYDGLWVAAGHYRTGAQLAPGTAEVISQAIISGQQDPIFADLQPDRFQSGAAATGDTRGPDNP